MRRVILDFLFFFNFFLILMGKKRKRKREIKYINKQNIK